MSMLKYLGRMSHSQAASFLERVRWPDGPCCPLCGSAEYARQSLLGHRIIGYCRGCKRQSSVLHGTCFAEARRLNRWLVVLALGYRGVTSAQGVLHAARYEAGIAPSPHTLGRIQRALFSAILRDQKAKELCDAVVALARIESGDEGADAVNESALEQVLEETTPTETEFDRWLAERCSLGHGWTASRDLWWSWLRWCGVEPDGGRQSSMAALEFGGVGSRRKLAEKLELRGARPLKYCGRRGFDGIRLRGTEVA